ncbi:DNA polymerase IV [soil metagenome]
MDRLEAPHHDLARAAPRILHVDCDQFFVQCAYLTWPERLADVELLAVGGHPEKRGVVASCSYAARQHGVRSAMPMREALRLCPALVAAPVPWGTVRRKSRHVFRVLARFAEAMERVSVDEGYLLVPESGEPPEELARRIQRAVAEETGITVSIGGATVRFLAKMATSHAKPAGVFIVPAGQEQAFLEVHRLEEIPGIGPAFRAALARRGVTSISGARRIGLDLLTLWLGPARARFLWERVRTIDRSRIGAEEEIRKSISSETTFESDRWERDALETALDELVHDVGATLRKHRLRTRTVSVKLRSSDFQDRQKSRTLPQLVQTDRVIGGTARELLGELRHLLAGPVRLLGVSLSSLEGAGAVEQLAFREIIPPLEPEEEEERSPGS